MFRPSLFSFDVFDTSITRTYALPEDLHLDLGTRLRAAGVVVDENRFAEARRIAEHDSWARTSFRGAVAIDDIYSRLALAFGWSTETRMFAMATEIDLEKAAARPVPLVEATIRRRRQEGGTICFVSDTHLSGEHLRDILESTRIARPEDRIYASSDWNTTKLHRGGLFRHVVHHSGIWPWRIQHVGDHPRADAWMARMRLMRTTQLRHTHVTARERIILQHVPATDLGLRRLVVASRFARLRQLADPESSPVSVSILTDTIAPLIAGFSLWLLARAKQQGIARLYFLARDMQLVCDMTRYLASALQIDVQCIYTSASRAAWQPAAFNFEDDLSWLTDQLPRRTVRAALGRILDERALAELDSVGCEVSDAPHFDLMLRLQRLLAYAPCRTVVAAAVQRRRNLLLSYLKGLGFEANGSCALVDAGWRGSLQRTLSRALANDGCAGLVQGFYIGLRHEGRHGDDCPMWTLLSRARVESLGYSLVALTETFLTADHGSVLEYRCGSEGAVIPVTAAPPPASILHQVRAVRSACLMYAEELMAHVNVSAHLESLPAVLVRPFLHLCSNPDRTEASALRSWLFDAGRERRRLVPIATPVSVSDCARIALALLRGTSESDLYLSGAWVRGSLALTNRPLGLLLRYLLSRSVASIGEDLDPVTPS